MISKVRVDVIEKGEIDDKCVNETSRETRTNYNSFIFETIIENISRRVRVFETIIVSFETVIVSKSYYV